MKKLKNSKGFTLMEMLIVVAIIAILVAIAIPAFSNQLEKAREATDMANLRSGYALVVTSALTGVAESDGQGHTVSGSNGVWTLQVAATQKMDDWQSGNPNIAGYTVDTCATNGATWTITYTESTGEVTIEATT